MVKNKVGEFILEADIGNMSASLRRKALATAQKNAARLSEMGFEGSPLYLASLSHGSSLDGIVSSPFPV